MLPPQCIDLESVVLGILLDQWNLLDEVIGIIPTPETFYKPEHQTIYEAIQSVFNSGAPSNLIGVTTHLRKYGKLENVGGAFYLTQLQKGVYSTEPLLRSAIGVREASIRREQIRIASELQKLAYDTTTDIWETFDTIEQQLFNISQISTTNDTLPLEKITNDLIKNINEVRAAADEITGISTGFKEINHKTNGWQKTDLIIIAARPSVGKTAFALNLAMNAATDIIRGVGKSPGAIFSLEMGAAQVAKRILSANSKVSLGQINRPKYLKPEQINKFYEVQKLQREYKIFIDDTAAISIPQLRGKARKLKKKNDIQWLIIDYLQLMTGDRKKGGNREQEISQISRDLKTIAKELDIPIIALSQLNRIENDVEPSLSNLRESGAIEQDADLVIFIYNPSETSINSGTPTNAKMITCAKHRNGDTFSDVLLFNKEIQLFEDINNEPLFQQMKVDNPRVGIINNYPISSQEAEEKYNWKVD